MKEVPLDVVVLRPELAVCEQRAAERVEGRIADYGVYREFYGMFEGMPKHEVSGEDAVSTGRRIRERLDAGVFRV